jgi:hypothetical protein
MGMRGQRPAPAALPPPPPGKRELVPIAQETGWGPGQLWTGEVNIATTGIRCETNLEFNNTG